MYRVITVGCVVVLVVTWSPATDAQPLTLGQVDNFQNQTTQNWQQGFNSPPGALTVVGGGQNGASDFYLRIRGTGPPGGPGSRIVAFNVSQWAGNYSTAGINRIEMDLFAPTSSAAPALSFRIALKSGTNGYLSQAFTVPNDGAWRHAVYNLTESEMTAVGGPSSFGTFIQTVEEVRILHSTSTFTLTGEPINGIVGVDNIRASAIPIPEPTGLLAMFTLAVGVGWLARRQRGDC